MKLLITLIVFFVSTSSLAENLFVAQTDYTCVSDCTNKGYQYNLCTQRCSVADESTYTLPSLNNQKQTDYQCVNDCTAKGYQYNLCTNRCSF